MVKLLILVALVAILATTIEGKAIKQSQPMDLGLIYSGFQGPPGKRQIDWNYFKRSPLRYFRRLDGDYILVRQDDLLDSYFKKSADRTQPALDETFSP
ncbi:hypothetical protein TrispH2_000750 [Trichoplax sp. H2]|nr:hypothetical protein TrispH2_000750 [Trichoplax sp. H2]|eukprot:RDD47667.1 hypothetical protein TrispH2_000750 [Trichoplax sp. H2]